MIISTSWLKKFTDIDLPINELATLIGARLVEIEEVVDLGVKYQGVVVARVVEATPLEGSDHLNVVKLDDGAATHDVERDDAGYVQVVCGAPNVRAGILVAWLPPKTIVPQTFGTNDPFTLDARKLRGVMSNGMIASARELDLYDEHEGILEIALDIQPGISFADAFELNDYLMDIENKSLTHRPDCFGIIGFAREVAAIQGKAFHTPEWLAQTEPDFGAVNSSIPAPAVTIDDPSLSNRYQAVILSGADASAQSPQFIQSYLARVGVRPINAIVDVTNYLMMLTGQPLHAFDYDKLVAAGGGKADIHVRAGKDGELLALLDGRTIEVTSDDIVIASGDKAIGLAGAMGGSETEIDATTKNIIIESATFDLYSLRATQMRHGIFSEAITRFTKGQPAALTAPVLAEAVRLIGEFTKATRASDVAEAYPSKQQPVTLDISIAKIQNVLGAPFSADVIAKTLNDTEFQVVLSEDMITVTVPFWRSDIHIDEDIIEEIGRLNGFDSIKPVLPMRDFTAVRPTSFDDLRAHIRTTLIRAGANEVLTYNFVHGDVLKKADQDPTASYRIVNSISPELQYYRQSITPSLLGLVHQNIKSGFDSFALFELNKTHSKTAELVDEVPAEMHRLGLVIASKNSEVGAPYYKAKRLLEYLGEALGLQLEYKSFPPETSLAFTKPFELKRSARIVDVRSNQSIGIIGEYKKSVARNFKLPAFAAGFELLTEGISLALEHAEGAYAPLSKYPGTERDICFQVDQSVRYQEVVDGIQQALAQSPLVTSLEPIDLYQPSDGNTKNITVRITFQSYDRTLISDEVAEVVAAVVGAVQEKTGAKII